MKPVNGINKSEWMVADVSLDVCRELVRNYHYAGGGSNTATFRHGLFRKGELGCKGVAWWIPPTKSAAIANYTGDWRRVLVLHRLALDPVCPTNSASFLIAQSIKLIRKSNQWECLLTYADEGQKHTGIIYRATNWEYLGITSPENTWVDYEGRMISRKAGPTTRTNGEMKSLGYKVSGKHAKHRFRIVLGPIKVDKKSNTVQLGLAI